MNYNPATKKYVLMYVIVNFGMGSKVLKLAKQHGVQGGTVFLGTGTVKNRFLQFLELADIRREIVMMATDKSTAEAALESIDKTFELEKPYHGIAYTVPLTAFLGSVNYGHIYNSEGGTESAMYNSIIVVVDRGMAELAIDAATNAGARGGTIMHARGSGIHENSKLFNMQIEPEKEIVMILSEAASTEKIVDSIRDKLQIDKPGNGVIFCHDVCKTYGIS